MVAVSYSWSVRFASSFPNLHPPFLTSTPPSQHSTRQPLLLRGSAAFSEFTSNQMSLHSPRSPSAFSRQGFQPLDNATNNMNYETDIPLTSVRTNSSTGARKQGDEAIYRQPTFQADEKNGMFNRALGGRRKARKTNSRPKRIGTDGEEVSVNSLGRFYDKIVNFSVVTRYFVYVAPIALLIATPIIIYAVLDPTAIFASTGVRVIWFWTWIESIWLSIWVSKLVAKTIPWIFMFLCGVVSSGTRKYALILKAVEIPLSLVGWAVTTLVTFTALTQPSINGGIASKHWVSVVRQLLGPCLIASLLYLGEQVVIQLISVGYHRRSFDGRIQQSKHDVHLVGLLYEASRTLFPMYCREFLEEDYIINDSIEAMLAKSTGKMGHQRSGSATPLKLIGDVGRLGDKVTSVFGNIASEITGKQVFNPNSAHSIVVEALEKTSSSEALAKRLWMSFVVEGKEALYAEDVQEVLGPARKDEADEAFAALDNDGNGDISLDEMIMKIVDIGRDRKSISHSMRDVGQAIGVLDQILLTVLFVIIIFIFVAFQDTNFVTTLATAGTTLLSLSFVFAATTQEFLGSCIFLFVKHPFDVGDRVDIVGPTPEFLVVEQISLLYTVFKRIDSMKMVQVPNIVLNNLWIENITRSKAMKEQLDMFISFDTSLEDIEVLRKEMENFVRHPDNSRDFQPDIVLEATGIGNMDKLQLKVEIRHKSNWHNETIRAARRSKFMCALVLALRKVPIYGPGGGGEPLGGPTNPSYSVAVSDSLAAESRDKAAEAKEAKRLVPSMPAPKAPSGDFGPAGEEKAAEAMNARAPTADAAHETTNTDKAIWNSAEDRTLDSRDESLERHRSNGIEDLREGLIKRQSTRGRRRPGEVMPAVPTQDGPGFMLTQASPNREGFMGSVAQTLDEEAELGLHGTASVQGYTAYQGQPQGGYSIYPQPAPGSRGAQQLPDTSQAGASSQGRLKRLSLSLKPSNSTRGMGPSQ
ncbi:Mechanosensitive ion channel Msy1 [Hyphodiscus hymeniophilus]|uniref:Mechanosensitive ion channel Msy1 n=1 Tax=Hyphodiscus hymeniophilus TaxID=353542 RepID=A0A9P6VJA9_9HELO|nr:Mechanosensitive ion channel Msy1 [Hyphodiscus hymeniophilus]